MNQLTPAQVKVIETWTEKRDALLREIGVYESRLQIVKKDCIESGLALDDLHKQIAEARGRIAELDALEERHKNSISVVISELEIRKSNLEGDIKLLEQKINDADSRLNLELIVTKDLMDSHNLAKDLSNVISAKVGEIIQTSEKHTSEMGVVMNNIRTIATEVFEKSNKNIEQTNIVLGELPRFIFEMQRPIPVRRYGESRSKDGINRKIVDEIKTENSSLET